jgi:hypothetical protein
VTVKEPPTAPVRLYKKGRKSHIFMILKKKAKGTPMGKQHNRRIFAGFYKRYDNKYIYVVAVVPDVDTGSQVVIFHEGIDACECKYYSMTKQSFCEMVEVDGEWVDKFVRQPQSELRIPTSKT